MKSKYGKVIRSIKQVSFPWPLHCKIINSPVITDFNAGYVLANASWDFMGVHSWVDCRWCYVSHNDVFPNLRTIFIQFHSRVHITWQVCKNIFLKIMRNLRMYVQHKYLLYEKYTKAYTKAQKNPLNCVVQCKVSDSDELILIECHLKLKFHYNVNTPPSLRATL